MLRALSRVVPPPSYLTMSCVGVDISDNSLKYISFYPEAKKRQPKRLKEWGEITIPSEVVQRGMIQDFQKLTEVLKEFKAQSEAEFIRVSLPEERAYLFETEIKPNVPFKEVRSLLEFRLEENVPIPSRDVMFDFAILPRGNGDRTIKVAVAAYARETIQQYYEVCQAAELFPVSFEIEAQAMARAMVPADLSGAVMIVDFGKTRTGIGIVMGETLLYTSTIEVGGNNLSLALRQVLGEGTSEAEITELKNTQGLLRGVSSSEVGDTLINAISIIKDELATRMQYWHLSNGNTPDRRITTVVFCGGSSNLKGLPEYLTEMLGVSVIRGNVWENAFSLEHTVPPIDRLHSFGYATAIGLALRSRI